MLAAAVLIGHQTVPPMDRDDPVCPGRQTMLVSGDYVTVRFQDELRAKKPAGIYWLQSLTAGLLGRMILPPTDCRAFWPFWRRSGEPII